MAEGFSLINIVCEHRIYLCFLMWVLSCVNGLKIEGYWQQMDGQVCNYDAHLLRYSKLRGRTNTECAMKCFALPACKHSIFISESGECYLDDEHGLNTCDSSCLGYPCYHHSEVRNVAIGAATECSTVYSSEYSCAMAVDGIHECVWASYGEGLGHWIRIDFGHSVILTHGSFMQRQGTVERNKDIQLEFSDGSVQQLPFHGEVAFVFDDIVLVPVRTTWVKVTTQSIWSIYNNGWAEIQLFARVRKDTEFYRMSESNYTCGP